MNNFSGRVSIPDALCVTAGTTFMPRSESDPSKSPGPRRAAIWRFLFRDKLPLERETAWFVLVNVFDFFATYLLLRRGGFRESNPIARWFMEGWGAVQGLLWYKLALVAFVCVMVQIIARRRLRTARWVLWFGTGVVGVVVIYSITLLVRSAGGG